MAVAFVVTGLELLNPRTGAKNRCWFWEYCTFTHPVVVIWHAPGVTVALVAVVGSRSVTF